MERVRLTEVTDITDFYLQCNRIDASFCLPNLGISMDS